MASKADAALEAMLIASETLSANAAAAASTCAHAVSETVSAGKVAANAACASSRETSELKGVYYSCKGNILWNVRVCGGIKEALKQLPECHMTQ